MRRGYKPRAARDDQRTASGWERALKQILPHGLGMLGSGEQQVELLGLWTPLWGLARPQPSKLDSKSTMDVSNFRSLIYLFLSPHKTFWYHRIGVLPQKTIFKDRDFSLTNLRNSDKDLDNASVKWETEFDANSIYRFETENSKRKGTPELEVRDYFVQA